jgi:uncharacterized repeat protein (TIGR01451 family)
MVLAFALFIINVSAAVVSEATFTINDVTLTDFSGNPLGIDIPKDSDVRITYSFDVDNITGDTINDGDTFVYDMPDEINVSYPATVEVRDGINELILTATASMDNVITVTFTDYCKTHSNVTGTYWFDFGFDSSNIGSGEPVNILFPIDANSGTITVPVNFDQPLITPTINKTGSYDSATKEITWILTANSEETAVDNMQIVDALSADHEFVSGSATLNGVPLADVDVYNSGSRSIEYAYTEQVTTEQILVFKTEVSPDSLLAATGSSLSVSNSAVLYDNGIPINSPTRTINVPVDLIDKKGSSYDAGNQTIDWTITVNTSAVDINNAVVTDLLESGLTFDSATAQLDGTPMTEGTGAGQYQISGQEVTFYLGNISSEQVITFTTDVDEYAYIDGSSIYASNTATLNGDGVVNNNTDSSGNIGVGTETVQKSGTGYDPHTGIVSWEVTINPGQFSLDDAVFTDTIRSNMDYIPGTFTIINDTNPGTNLGVLTYDEPADILTYTFPSTITDTYTITFDTQVVTDIFNEGGDTGLDAVTLENTAQLQLDIGSRSSYATVTAVKDPVVEKSYTAYDWDTNRASWEIVVNSGNYDMANMVITDTIASSNHTYVAVSVSIVNNTNPGTNLPSLVEASDGFTYTFPVSTSDSYTITLDTQVVDSELYNNGNLRLDNSLVLDHDDIPFTIYDQSREEVPSEIIQKAADYTNGDDYIDWTITANRNEMPISNAVISDTLQEGLSLDTTSLVLYEASIDSDGTVVKGTEIVLSYPEDFTYDFETRTLQVNLPTPSSKAYLLEFRTYVTDKTQSPFTNTAGLTGDVVDESYTTGGTSVAFSGSGGSGSGEVGAITVHKVNSDDVSENLSGAVFNLYDKYGILIQTGTTDSNGALTFERIRYDVPYTVEEVTAPTGYVINETTHEFIIPDDGDTSNVDIIEYMWENTPIKADVCLFKRDDANNPVEGAVFTLYDETGTTPVQIDGVDVTATSSSAGLVTFADVEYGNYQIKETTTPKGYLSYSGTDITVSVGESDNGLTLYTSPSFITNVIIKGNIELKKVDMDDQPLQGAIFTLYDDEGLKIRQATSETDGTVSFTNVQYGTYTIVETKAPAGYKLSTTETITANVTSEGVTVYANPYTIYNKYILETFTIPIKDKDEQPIPRVVIQLIDEHGNIVTTITSTTTGEIEFPDIPAGEYTVHIVSVPDGYEIPDKEIIIIVDENGVTIKENGEEVTTLDLEIEEEVVPETTRTGDNIQFVMLGFVTSFVLLIMLVYYRRKKINE